MLVRGISFRWIEERRKWSRCDHFGAVWDGTFHNTTRRVSSFANRGRRRSPAWRRPNADAPICGGDRSQRGVGLQQGGSSTCRCGPIRTACGKRKLSGRSALGRRLRARGGGDRIVAGDRRRSGARRHGHQARPFDPAMVGAAALGPQRRITSKWWLRGSYRGRRRRQHGPSPPSLTRRASRG